MRDSQRRKLYDAEAQAFGQGKNEMTLAEVQALVNKILSSKVIQRRYPRARFTLTATDGRSRRRGGYHAARDSSTIAMPRWTRCKWYTLHEIAHHLAWEYEEAGHGWRFAAVYLDLVRIYMGRSSEQALKQAYKDKRVKYREPRRRQMSDEQREAARQRMLAMHAAKREVAAGRTQ